MLSRAAVLLAGVTLGGCHLIPCTSDSQCPPPAFCDAPGTGARGTCVQECVVSSQCGAGRICGSRGRCVTAEGNLVVDITEPQDGRTFAPGEVLAVAGTVTVGGDPVTVQLGGVDGLGCTPVEPQTQQLLSEGALRAAPFRFEGVVAGEGGGTLEVRASAATREAVAERHYGSAVACADCGRIVLDSPPPSSALEPYALGVTLSGSVTGAVTTPLLFSITESGARLELPLVTGAGGAFTTRLVPLAPGRNRAGVRVTGVSGARECSRIVDAEGASTPLSVHLSWEGVDADLDLVLVPPGGRYSVGACRAGADTAGCSVPTGDRRAPGPEAVLVDNLSDGTWGVVVLSIPAPEGPVRAVVQLLQAGAVLGSWGPRVVDPRVAEVWVPAVLQVQAGSVLVEGLDRVQESPPGGAPADW
ncbi:MAG: hypothetical protein HY904_24810 [Deltaproteobacteria bacterium]|nr:hypothetical protein [Deltaproteobacteria bacterium]